MENCLNGQFQTTDTFKIIKDSDQKKFKFDMQNKIKTQNNMNEYYLPTKSN